MERLFIFLGSNFSIEKFIPLMDDLNGINCCFFSDIKSFKHVINRTKPDAFLIHEPDFIKNFSENENNSIFDQELSIILIGSGDLNDIPFKSQITSLSEDFTSVELLQLFDRPEVEKKEFIFSAEMLDLIIRHIPTALFWKDKDLKFIGCDTIFCKDRGLSDQCDVYGLTDFDLFPKDVALKNIQIDQEILLTGKSIINYIEEVMNADGSVDILRKSKIPIKDQFGEVILIMGLYEKITDQIFMQEHLKLEKQYLQMLMDNIPDTIYFKDRDSKFVRINKAQATSLGLNHPDEAIGKSDVDFFDERHSSSAFFDEQKLMETCTPLVNKLEYIRTSQGYKYVTDTKIPLLDNSGKCIGMVGVSRDVTQEHLVEEELRHEKELMNLLMDNIPDRIYFKDKDSKFLRANKALVDLFGMKNQEDLYGKTSFDFNEYEYAKKFFDDEQELMNSGIPLINNIESHMRNGSLTWSSTTKIPLFNKSKELIGLVGISRDFTKQKDLENALVKEKDLLQCLMDNVPDYIYFKDLNYRYIRVNKAVALAYELKDFSEIIGKTDLDFSPPEIAAVFKSQDKEIYTHGKPLINKVVKTILPNREVVWLSTTKIPVKDENDQIIGLVGISRDVSVLELTKQRFQHAKEKAEEANKAKSLFLANMSHEIRTPMNGVIGMADILRRTKLDPTQYEYLQIIMNSGQTLLTIINDILDFSKIESGKMTLEKIPISIRCIVEEVADIMILSANEKAINLLTYVDADIPDFVCGDYVRLKQIITNLVNNAIKFTALGEVFISVVYKGTHANKHEVLFKIADTGIGISKQDQTKLFQSFSQVDTSTTRKFGGTGLGLAISQRLVNEMDGKFYVESEEGKGSVFSFTAKFDNTEERQESNIQFKNISFKNLNVLIVDDNKTNRKIFSEYLQKWEMKVFEVTNGDDALLKLLQMKEEGQIVNLVLVDYQMAGMNGLELAQKIKEDSRIESTRLVMISSVTDVISRDQLKKFGFEFYLNKPLKLKELFNVVAAVVGSLKQVKKTEEEFKKDRTDFNDSTFLIVEDNDVNMKVAQYSLKSLSSHVFMAYDGSEAVQIFNTEKIDFILMDIQMPVMNGIEATLKIRELEKQRGSGLPVKIIAMTANTMRADMENCMKAGMDAFLGKPFRVNDLVNVLLEIK